MYTIEQRRIEAAICLYDWNIWITEHHPDLLTCGFICARHVWNYVGFSLCMMGGTNEVNIVIEWIMCGSFVLVAGVLLYLLCWLGTLIDNFIKPTELFMMFSIAFMFVVSVCATHYYFFR